MTEKGMNAFIAMIEGIRKLSVEAGMIDEKVFDDGIKVLHRTL
jgi:hypothetical protein